MKNINPEDFRVKGNDTAPTCVFDFLQDMEKLTDITEPELAPKGKANIGVYREQLKG